MIVAVLMTGGEKLLFLLICTVLIVAWIANR